VRGTGDLRAKALGIANDFDARVVDDTTESFVFEVSGSTDKIERCIASLLPVGLVEVSRSGIVAITRGAGEM
jgi:acetolactate synthase-1/3 small subunit